MQRPEKNSAGAEFIFPSMEQPHSADQSPDMASIEAGHNGHSNSLAGNKNSVEQHLAGQQDIHNQGDRIADGQKESRLASQIPEHEADHKKKLQRIINLAFEVEKGTDLALLQNEIFPQDNEQPAE